MRLPARLGLIAAAWIAALVAVPTPASACSLYLPSAVATSDLIVVGQVTHPESAWNAIEIVVERYLKGSSEQTLRASAVGPCPSVESGYSIVSLSVEADGSLTITPSGLGVTGGTDGRYDAEVREAIANVEQMLSTTNVTPPTVGNLGGVERGVVPFGGHAVLLLGALAGVGLARRRTSMRVR